LPYGFTELGVAMLSSVLNSERAVQMNILIMRTFVKLRELLASHKDLARDIEKLEVGQKEHAVMFALVAKGMGTLAKNVNTRFKEPQAPSRRETRIGFIPGSHESS